MQTKTLTEFKPTDTLYKKVIKATYYQINHPNPGSKFEEVYEQIKHLPDETKMAVLLQAGNNILFGYEGDNLLGLFAYQQHEDGWHMFRAWVMPEHRKKGHIWPLTKKYLEHTRENCPQKRTRLSQGNDETLIRIVDMLHKHQDHLKLKVDKETYWVETP